MAKMTKQQKGYVIIGGTAVAIAVAGVLFWYINKQQQPVTPSNGFIPSTGGSTPQCTQDSDCPTGYVCDDGYCVSNKSKEYHFTGKVIDSNGKGVPGTPIVVKYGNPSSPQTTTTQTNDNGVYYINITWQGEPPVFASATEKTENITVQKTVSAEGNYTLDDIKFSMPIVWPELNRRARNPPCSVDADCPQGFGLSCQNGECLPITPPALPGDHISTKIASLDPELIGGKNVAIKFCSEINAGDIFQTEIYTGDGQSYIYNISSGQCARIGHTYATSGRKTIRIVDNQNGYREAHITVP